jgi:site-specific DNA-methyltransferase (adenine-specific)
LQSPPYNANKNSHLNGVVSGFENKYENNSDELSDDEFLELLIKTTENAIEISDYCFINLQLLTHNRKPIIKFQNHFVDYLKDILIWNKSTCPPNIVKGAFNTKWEYVFSFSNDNKTRGFPTQWQGKYPNVIETENNSGNENAEIHKAGFPLAFPKWIIEKMDFVQSVTDLFGGTGTTLIACEQLNKQCFTMELDPKYCDVIIKRWESYTGKTAELIED